MGKPRIQFKMSSLIRPDLLWSLPMVYPICQSFISFFLITKTMRYIADTIYATVPVPMLMSEHMHSRSYLPDLSVEGMTTGVASEIKPLHGPLTLRHLRTETQPLSFLHDALLVIFISSDEILPWKKMAEGDDRCVILMNMFIVQTPKVF